jgi:hypothetical protein
MVMEAEATKLALARSMLARLDQDYIEALKLAVAEELRAEVYPQALAEARAELEEAFERRRARLDDQQAAYREELDSEVETRIERGIEQARAEVLADVEDRLTELREERTQARQQRDAAEHALLGVLRQLLAEKGRYLRNANILEFDQFGLNAILKRHGWRVRSKQTYSERVVKTRLEEARWQTRNVFWLDTVPGEGVADEEEAETEDRDTSEGTPSRLALPEPTGL